MTSFFRFLIVSLAFTLGTTNLTHAASFDCSKATTETEIAICNDPELSALDERMSKAYSGARQSEDGKQIKQRQLEWIKTRNSCLSDNPCLRNSYEEILLELRDFDYEYLIMNTQGKQQVCKTLLDDGLSSGEDASMLLVHREYNQCIEDLIVDLMTSTTNVERNILKKDIEQLRNSYQGIIYRIWNGRKECSPFCGSMFKLYPPYFYGNLLDELMAEIIDALGDR